MSSKVQLWRTPVIAPSGVKISSLFIVTQTWGCALAASAPARPKQAVTDNKVFRIDLIMRSALYAQSSSPGRHECPGGSAPRSRDFGEQRYDQTTGGARVRKAQKRTTENWSSLAGSVSGERPISVGTETAGGCPFSALPNNAMVMQTAQSRRGKPP